MDDRNRRTNDSDDTNPDASPFARFVRRLAPLTLLPFTLTPQRPLISNRAAQTNQSLTLVIDHEGLICEARVRLPASRRKRRRALLRALDRHMRHHAPVRLSDLSPADRAREQELDAIAARVNGMILVRKTVWAIGQYRGDHQPANVAACLRDRAPNGWWAFSRH